MRLHGRTDRENWHPLTLLGMMIKWEFWHCGFDMKDWRLSASYTWYDGPMWHLNVGPFWIAIAH